MPIATSSVKKGETLIDTAMTLNAMRPDLLVIRHGSSGAVKLLSRKVDCAVINAGDGTHEHPTQALLDALTIRRRVGDIGATMQPARRVRRCFVPNPPRRLRLTTRRLSRPPAVSMAMPRKTARANPPKSWPSRR
jgi:hypothetical protein